MTSEERIRERIAEYTAQRDRFLSEANQQIAALNGAIQALEALLAPESQRQESDGDDPPATPAAGS